jgi:hypothetical protein
MLYPISDHQAFLRLNPNNIFSWDNDKLLSTKPKLSIAGKRQIVPIGKR